MSLEIISNFPAGGGNNLKPKIVSAQYKEIELPISLYWQSIAYGNGVFVAIGVEYVDDDSKTTNKYLYSTDGEHWIEGILPETSYWYQVDFIKDRFYISNTPTSYILVSKDGIHWNRNNSTKIGTGTVSGIVKIVYGSGVFVAIGASTSSKGYIAYSYDTIQWYVVEQPFKEQVLNDITYGNGMFIATIRRSNNYIYSYDGKRWQLATLDFDSTYINRSYITYGAGKFVINIYFNTNVSLETQQNLCFISEDGLNWKKIELYSESVGSIPLRFSRVNYINGMFFTTSNSPVYTYSYDGENWKTSECYYGIARTNTVFAKGKFVSFKNYSSATSMNKSYYLDVTVPPSDALYLGNATNDDKLLNEYSTSINTGYGTSGNAEKLGLELSKWQEVNISSATGGKKWIGIAFGNGMYIALQQGSSDKYNYSYDGISWLEATFNTGQKDRRTILYGNGLFVVFGYNENKYEYSTDGMKWTSATFPATYGVIDTCAYANGVFIAVDYGTIYYSFTGNSSWQTINTFFGSIFGFIAYGDSKFIIAPYFMDYFIVLQESFIDGTRKLVANSIAMPLTIKNSVNQGIAYGNGVFVSILGNVTTLDYKYSYNGTTWKDGEFPFDFVKSSIAYINGMFVVTAEKDNQYLYSYDGINWDVAKSELLSAYDYSTLLVLDDMLWLGDSTKTIGMASNGTYTPAYANYQFATLNKAPKTELILGDATPSEILEGATATSKEGYSIQGTAPIFAPTPTGYTDITANFRSIVNATDIVYDENQKKLFIYCVSSAPSMVENNADGLGSWTRVTSGISNLPRPTIIINSRLHNNNIVYHNGKYLSMYNSSSVYKSTDGKEWTNTGISISNAAMVKWLNDRFVVIGLNKFYYSTDGETFTESTRTSLSSSGGYWYDVAYGNGVYVAVFMQNSGNSVIAYSTDNCATWTQKTLSSTAKLRAIAYGAGLFVAIPDTGQEYLTSTDGINWTTRASFPSNASSIQNNCITFVSSSESSTIGNLFIVGKGKEDTSSAYNPTNIYYTSTDGLTWTARTFPITSHCNNIRLCNGKLYAVFNRNTVVCSSTNGTSWTTKNLNNYETIINAAYGNGKLLVLTHFNGVSVSDDYGNTWVCNKTPLISYANSGYRSMVYGKGIFSFLTYAATSGLSGNGNFWTEDGETFTKMSTSLNMYKNYFLNGMFFSTASNYNCYYSTDGKEYQKTTFPRTFNTYVYMTYGNGIYVAVTQNLGGIAYSFNGIIWNSVTVPIFANSVALYNIVYGNGVFLACVNAKELLYSTTGNSWSVKENPTGVNAAIKFLNGVFWNGQYYSYDGLHWEKQKQNTLSLNNNLIAEMGNNLVINDATHLYIESVRIVPQTANYLGDATAEDILKGKRATSKYGYSIVGTAEKEGVYPISSENITGNIEYTSCNWSDMEWGNSTYIVTESNNTLTCKSTNGTTWTTGRNIANLFSICFGNGKFIGVYSGSIRNLYTTTNGNAWTRLSNILPLSYSPESMIRYLNGQFIIAGGNVLYYSTNGDTWTQSAKNGITTTGNYWKDIAYGNGMYVLIYVDSYNGTIAYSTDLENWTEIKIGSIQPYRITYGAGKFVIVSNNSTTVAYSTDGITWTLKTSALSTNIQCQTIEYGNGMFIAAGGYFGVNTYFTSTDGITWTARTFPISRGICKSIKFRNNYWFAVFAEDYRILRSSNGTSWNTYTLYNKLSSFQEIAYGNDVLLVQARYSEWFRSTDKGKSWTRYEFAEKFENILSNFYHRLVFGNGVFTLVYNNILKYYSRDGITWNKISSTLSTDIGNVWIYNNMFFYFPYGSSKTTYYTSTDGITLTQRTAPFALSYQDILCYGAGKYVLWKANASAAAYSTDGINWTSITIPTFASTSKTVRQIAYGHGRFVAVVSTTEMITSTDGVNWSVVENKANVGSSIFFINGIFVMGTIYYSYDSLKWIVKSNNINRGATSSIVVKLWDNAYAFDGGRSFGTIKAPAEDAYYLGNARPEDVPKGITFSSIHGYGLEGTK